MAATVRDRYSDDEIKGFYEAGYWRQDSLFDLVEKQAAAGPDKLFVFDDTVSLTYRQMRESALRLAAGLQRRGIGHGDRVVAQLPNWTEFALVCVALGRLGAVLVPVMPIYRQEDVRYVLKHSGAKAAISAEEFKGFRYLDMFEELRGDCPELELLLVARPSGAANSEVAVPLSEAAADGPLEQIASELRADASPEDPLLLVYTSGTTSRPKGCLHVLNTLRASAEAIKSSTGYDESDVQFGPSPITHSTGFVTSFLLPLLAGASSHLMEAWEPGEGFKRIEENRCTVAVTATAFLQMLIAAYDPQQHNPSSMRLWICAGSPIPGSVVQQAADVLTNCRVLSLYGRSENMLTTMCTIQDPPERSSRSDGAAIAGANVAIVDEQGKEVPRRTEGDIAYKGPGHMLGYYDDPEQTKELFTPGGYSRSGDLGYMDEDGYVRVTGRLKDIVIRGGLNISAREVEDLLVEHSSVSSVAVVGMPDERLGERACVYVVPAEEHDELTLDDLTSYLRDRQLATPKLPERLELIDQLPMTATGKIQKHELRADLARRMG